MNRKRHSPEQIIKALREAEAMFATSKTVAQVIQWLGINEKTYYRWRTKHGGLKSEEAKRLQVLELENTRLKRLIAHQAIENAILKEANDFLGKPRAPHERSWS